MKVLMATDGSKDAKNAAQLAAALLFGSADPKIRIVSVAENASPIVTEQIVVSNDLFLRAAAESKKAAKNAVEELKAVIEKAFEGREVPEIETAVIEDSAREGIVRDAEEWGADVIVVGSHGYGFWDRMLIGSVSDAVVHHAPCSVLVVRQPRD
ncbi:MAG: universal stress protein [Acidobacteriota bacterium]|nr:universal stress protein [Acidobacteriota bacterium]MDH3531067.1 universal stress protein [Acidobacteriota bacterium]